MDILKIRGFILFVVAVLNLLLALFLLLRRKDRKDIFWLSATIFFSGLYALFSGGVYFFWQENSFASILWYRLTWAGVLILPSFVIFTYYFTGRLKLLKIKILLFYLTAAIIAYLAFATDLFVDSVRLGYPNISGIPGPLDAIGRFFIGFCILIGIGNLLREYFHSSGFKKLQTRYFIVGIVIYAVAGTVVTSIVPFFMGESPYYDIAAYFSLIWIGLTSYAIMRYRLMDIRFILSKGAVYIFSFAGVLSAAYGLIYFNGKLSSSLPFNFIAPLVIVLSIILFQIFFRFFEKFASKYFYYTFYSYQKVLTDLGKELTQVLDLDKLSTLILTTLIDTMKLDKTVILLKNPDGDNDNYVVQKNIGFKENNGISLIRENFLTEYLEKTQSLLVFEEIPLIIKDVQDIKEKERLEEVSKNMKSIEAGLCLPLLSENKIFGMIVLGNKISGDPYSNQDIDLLNSLGNQASITLQNAKLYSEMKWFNIRLESEVEKRTRELKEAYEELQKLDKAKSEFLSIASHQLRTPLTAIKGYISMMLENTFGVLDEKMQKPLENIYTSNERLIKLVNDLLNISRIEAGRLEMKIEETDLVEMINSIFEELKPTVQMKKIYLKLEKPAKESKISLPKMALPKVAIDPDKIRQVFMNIIDNAIRYTPKGGITIKTSLHKNFYQIKITDTGEGMTPEDIADLFDSFSRGRAGNKHWTEGMGLGLYVAKKFVDLHKGKIWAESKGKGKGSAFFIELPLN